MIRILLVFLFISFTSIVFAQNLSLEMDTITFESSDLDESPYIIYGKLKNHQSSDQRYVWQKEIINCPDDWTVSMCIGELCYLHTVNSKTERILADENHEYSLYLASINGETGQCDVCVTFVVVGETDTIVGCNFWTLGTVGNDESKPITISFYPNPVQNFMNINNDIPVEIMIANTLGQTSFVRNIPAGTNEIDLSNLSRGVYTIAFRYQGENILTKQFIKR